MTFSVLMSVYKNDKPEFFKIALESIYEKQTRKPDEIILVFDGPVSDELSKVADDFASDKNGVVKFVKYPENKGLGEALRIGSEHCTCDYICRMDSDDISVDTRFEKQIGFAEAHPEIDVIGGDIAEFSESPDEENKRLRVCPETHKKIVKMAKTRSPINHMTVCMRRSALEKCGGYQTLLLVEDYFLWVRFILEGSKFANIHEVLAYARVGNGFIGRRSSPVRVQSWKKLQDYMVEHKFITRFRAAVNMTVYRIFTNAPSGIKKILYKKVLRK